MARLERRKVCFLLFFSCKGGDNRRGQRVVLAGQLGVLKRERLGHGEILSTIVRIHRVIHYIRKCVIVSGHFTQRHEASELRGSDIWPLLPQW